MESGPLAHRKRVWIALSDLWLDTELDTSALDHMAHVIRASELSKQAVEDIFTYELAPFLYTNLRASAGEWSGFDPEWVCVEAAKRMGAKTLTQKLVAKSGVTTSAARDVFEQVKARAFETR